MPIDAKPHEVMLQLICSQLLVLLPATQSVVVLLLPTVDRGAASVCRTLRTYLHGVQLIMAVWMSIGCRYPIFSCQLEGLGGAG